MTPTNSTNSNWTDRVEDFHATAQISLYPKAFDVLTFVGGKPGRVVTKEEIFKAVWQESFVEEGDLAQQVSSLCKALGDRASYIVTIPGKGYQFVARVEEARSDAAPFPDAGGDIVIQRVRERTQVVVEESFPAPVHPDIFREKKQKDAADNRRGMLIVGAIILATGAALFPVAITALHLWKKSPAAPSAKTDTVAALIHRRSAAVLGFRIFPAVRRQEVTDDEIRDWCLLSRTLLWEGKAAAANEVMQRAQIMAAKSQNPRVRWQLAIEDARICEAQFVPSPPLSSKPGVIQPPAGFAARKELAVVIARSHKSGFRLIELDARFALAEFEMKAGQTAQGRAHLTAIENDARAIEYILVARNAVIARG